MSNEKPMDSFSRRSFIAGAGALAAAGVAAVAAPQQAFAETAPAEVTMPAPTRIFDGVELAIGHVVHNPDICSGCRTCEIVCSTYHYGECSAELSNIQWRKNIMDACITNIMTCKQCPGAECVAVCPSGALYVDKQTGARVIDEAKCVGCQLCMKACPVEPSRIRYSAKKNVCFKCDLCGGEPQCVKFCPMGALRESWVEYVDYSGENEMFVKNFTGNAAAFTHLEPSTVQLSTVGNDLQIDAVVWTSHATQFNIVRVDYTITAEVYDKAGNLMGTSAEPAFAAIPEMQSNAFVLMVPGAGKIDNIGKIVFNVDGQTVTNAPVEEV